MALTKEALDAYIQGLYDDDGQLSSEDYQLIINFIVSNGEPEVDPRDLIQIRRGNEADVPNLAQGEFGYTLDENNLYIGGLEGNNLVNRRAFYNIKEFGVVGDDVTDETDKIQEAIDTVNESGGGILFFPEGKYLATRLTIKSRVMLFGSGVGITYLRCIDNSAGSFLVKADDGDRVVYFGMQNISVVSAISGVADSEDTFQNVRGVNLCACERGFFNNIGVAGFGNGAIVLARAEAGAEGLGFLNTTQDGNYNTFVNVYLTSCGKYNAEQAAISLKYKANSNKFYGIYGKPVNTTIVITHGNDNLVDGVTAESSTGVAIFDSMAFDNTIFSARAENVSSDAIRFEVGSKGNIVIGVHLTSVTGENFNDLSGLNRYIGASDNNLRSQIFPPVSSVSTLHNQGALKVTSINGDENYPVYIKAEDYNLGHPKVVGYDTKLGLDADEVAFEISAYTSDTSTDAKGENAKIKAIGKNTIGKMGWLFETGTNNITAPIFEINDHAETVGNGGWDNPHLVLGTYHIWVDSLGVLRIKNGAPTSDTDGIVVGSQV